MAKAKRRSAPEREEREDGDAHDATPEQGSGQPTARDRQDSKPAAGIECRKCGCRHWLVLWKRAKPGYAWRLLECRHCGHRITTQERPLTSFS
jgi:Zn ribbon nucleic-acid-binding protein